MSRVLVSAALWLCAGTAALLCAGTARADVHVVAVGSNRGEPDEVTLSYAERDAEVVASVFKRLGGASDVSELYGEPVATVRATLAAVGKRLAADPNGTLIVYFSGHADARGLHIEGELLPYDEVKRSVLAAPCRVRILILDACRSGSATLVKGSHATDAFAVEPAGPAGAEGSAIISSSAAGEDSHESDRLRGSFFTHHFVNALRGIGDRNGDRRVTLSEAYDYAYNQTVRASGRTASLQHPTFAYGLKGRGDVVLTNLDRDRSRSGRLEVRRAGLYLVLEQDEDGAVAAEVAVRQGGATLLLPPGNYFVQRRDQNQYDEWSLRLDAGGLVTVTDPPLRSVAYSRLVRKGGGERTAIHGLVVLGGARGQLIDGEPITGQAVIGYTADLPWLTVGARLRLSGSPSGGQLDGTHLEGALGVTLERVIDLPWLSVSIGVLLEGVMHHQSFATTGEAPARTTWAFGFGALLGLERDLTSSLVLRLEGGPVAQVFQQARIDGGVATGSELATPVTWWATGGLGWRF